jgi:hypothetical protein
MSDCIRLSGPVHTWSVLPDGKDARRYLSLTLLFRDARRAFKPDQYNALTGKGEQRGEVATQIRALKKAILGVEFTPTPIAVGVRPRHLKLLNEQGSKATLEVDPGDPLPLTDGQQRLAALGQIYDEAEKGGDHELAERVADLPISLLVHLDGDTQLDFVRLQLGKSVDAAHLASLRVQKRLVPEKDREVMNLAQEVAKWLNTDPDSPMYRLVRFDSMGCSPLPVTTICAKGASDLGSSLVGLAKVAISAAVKDPQEISGYFYDAVAALKNHHPELLQQGTPFTPPPDGGKGQATALIGLATLLVYRLTAPDAVKKEKAEVELAKAAHMFKGYGGGMSAQGKRSLMGQIAAEYLTEVEGEKHQGLPVDLLRTLSASAYGVSPLPKVKRSKPS